MKTSLRHLLISVLLAAGTAWAMAAELPERDEYAYGFPLVTEGDSEFFAVDIPLAVYRSVTDPSLRDAGVYNADGQPVPRIIERPELAEEGIEQELSLGLIPLYGQAADHTDQLRLLLLRESDRTRLELNTESSDEAENAANPLTAYIVDLREVEQELQSLVLDWPSLPQGFIGTVRLDTSNDLRRWRHLGSSALADLQFEEAHIRQNRLQLARNALDYLRITWTDLPQDWRLDSVTGLFTGQGPSAPRAWLELDQAEAGQVEVESTRAEHFFDVGGHPPVDRVNLLLPDDNVVLRASVFHRRHQEDRWRLAHNGIFYNIVRQGSSLQSSAATIDQVRAGQWKVRIESGVTAGPVRLQLGWRPDRLVFLAQGPAPYELLSGNADDGLRQFPQESILGDGAIFEMLRQSGEAATASLGDRAAIGGVARLQSGDGFGWKRVLVWLGLIGAVGFVGWLVYSLLREMRDS